MIGYMPVASVISKLRSNGSGVAWSESVRKPYPGHMFNYETENVTLAEVADFFDRILKEYEGITNELIDNVDFILKLELGARHIISDGIIKKFERNISVARKVVSK